MAFAHSQPPERQELGKSYAAAELLFNSAEAVESPEGGGVSHRHSHKWALRPRQRTKPAVLRRTSGVGPLRPRRPRPFVHVSYFDEPEVLINLHLLKTIATATGYNLAPLYNALLEQRVPCQYMADKSVLHFEISHTSAIHHFNRSDSATIDLHNDDLNTNTRWIRSRSADALPLTAKRWLTTGVAPTCLDHTLDCFVFASGAFVLWGLKPQLHLSAPPISNTTDESPTSPTNKFKQLSQVMHNNAIWNSDIVVSLIWFLSQFAEETIRPDWDSEDTLHYLEQSQTDSKDRNNSYDDGDSDYGGGPTKPGRNVWELKKLRRGTSHKRRSAYKIRKDILFLKTRLLEEKLAVSLAAAQSAVLGTFEESIRSTVQSLGNLPLGELSSKLGGAGLPDPHTSRSIVPAKWVSRIRRSLNMDINLHSTNDTVVLVQKLATVYLQVIDVNLVRKLVDVPEVFWENPRFQRVWSAVHNHMDVRSRVETLNSRCAWIKQLLSDMTHSRNDDQASEMTWVCIVWIIVYIITLIIDAFWSVST